MADLEELIVKIPNCEYREYLNAMMAEARRLKKQQ